MLEHSYAGWTIVGWCGMKIDGKVIPECDGKYESTIQE